MIKELHDALFANGGILFSDEHSGNVTSISRDEMGILIVDLVKINLDGVNFMKIILRLSSYLLLGVIDLNNAYHIKTI